MANQIVLLHSVGSVIDMETLQVVPQWSECEVSWSSYINEEGVHLADCTDEWWSSLSPQDLQITTKATNRHHGGWEVTS